MAADRAGPVRFAPRTRSGSRRESPRLLLFLRARDHREPSRVEAAGTKPKLIDEFVGRVNTGEGRLSVARMRSPEGWQEPGQRPDFDEYTVVIDGALRVEHEAGAIDVRAGQAVLVARASGCATPRPRPAARTTSRSACRRSRPTPSTATRTEVGVRRPR